MAEDQKQFLRKLYRGDEMAKKILDYLATRKLHRAVCFVTRTANKSGAAEDEVKRVFRLLYEQGFGRYVKSSRGHPARFEWGTCLNGDTLDYSLISVGRVAKGSDEALDASIENPDDGEEEDESDDEEAERTLDASFAAPKVMTISTYFKGAAIRIDLPVDFDPETEADELRDVIVMMVKQRRPRNFRPSNK